MANIDLSKFSQNKNAIVPIIEKQGRINGRKIELNVEDGWYELELGDKVRVIRKATPLQIEKVLKNEKSYIGFPIGTEFIPENFDHFKRKGCSESIRFFLAGTTPLFTAARVVIWEDGKYYFWKDEPGFARETLQSIRECFNRGVGIGGVHQVTPEQRYLFIIARLYQNSYNAYRELESAVVSKAEKDKHIANYKMDFGSRLRDVITDAGGTFNSYTKRGDSYIVEWTSQGQRVKSIINDDMRILNAGFCLSGDDEKHTLSSVVMLAKMFQEDEPLFITRE